MKKYNEILVEINVTYSEIQVVNGEIDELSKTISWKSFNERNEKRNDSIDKKLSNLGQKVKDLELTYKYLKNNAKIAAFYEFLPVILEVWNKYANKPYGTKTKEKIYNEIKERCNCSFYIDNGFCITPLKDGYRNTGYDFTCGTKYENGSHKPLLVDNKIQSLEFSDFELYYIKREYVENIPETIKTIRELETAAIEKQKELEMICTKFNDLAVDGIEHIYCDKRIYRRL